MGMKVLQGAFVAVAIAGAAALAWSGAAHVGYRTADVEIEYELHVPNPAARSGSCGVERWAVKTGTDADARRVDLGNPVAATIDSLRSLPAPAKPPSNARVQPAETTVYTLDATVVAYRLEGDSDYRMVIRDAAGNTMFAEIPDPACVASGSPFAPAIHKARIAFDARLAASSRYKTTKIHARVTGIGFFDSSSGLADVAPNAIELHPVLDIVFEPVASRKAPARGKPNFR